MSLAESATAAPSTPDVAAICAAEILGLAGFSIVPALLPQFIEAWALTNTQAGWLAGIVSAGYMLAVIPLVSLTDRRPARQIYLASSALSALSSAAEKYRQRAMTDGHRFVGGRSVSAKMPNGRRSSAGTLRPFRSTVTHDARPSRTYLVVRHQGHPSAPP
jgi:hypothetical protein